MREGGVCAEGGRVCVFSELINFLSFAENLSRQWGQSAYKMIRSRLIR